MTLRTYYRLALILPLLGLGGGALLSASGYGPRYYLRGTVAWEFPAVIVQTLLVYCLLAAWLWVQFARRPATRLAPLVWLAPLLFVALMLLVDLAGVVAHGSPLAPGEFLGPLLMTTLAVGGVGYGYVAALMLLRAGLRLVGLTLGESARAGA